MLRNFVSFAKSNPAPVGTQAFARPICIHAFIPANGSGSMKDVRRKQP